METNEQPAPEEIAKQAMDFVENPPPEVVERLSRGRQQPAPEREVQREFFVRSGSLSPAWSKGDTPLDAMVNFAKNHGELAVVSCGLLFMANQAWFEGDADEIPPTAVAARFTTVLTKAGLMTETEAKDWNGTIIGKRIV